MKGQVSIELMLELIVFLGMFVFFISFVIQQQTIVEKIGTNWENELACYDLADLVSQVYASGSGTSWVGTYDENYGVLSDTYVIMANGPINFTLDAIEKEGSGLGKDINAAYYNCNNAEIELYSFMSDFNVTLYVNDDQQGCGISNEKIQQLISDQNNYQLIYLEDARLKAGEKDSFNDWVDRGNLLIVSQRVIQNSGIFMGRNLVKKGYGSLGTATIVNTHYLFDFEIGDQFTFTDTTSILDPDYVIGVYPNGNPAISSFYYGDGEVIHISDIDGFKVGDIDYNFAEAIANSYIVLTDQNGSSEPAPLLDNEVFCNNYALVNSFILNEGERFISNKNNIVNLPGVN